MSGLSTNDRHSFLPVSFPLLSHGKSKFQPIRIKELLDSCKSDDDESEDKEPSSDDDSESEDFQPLSQDNSNEDIFTVRPQLLGVPQTKSCTEQEKETYQEETAKDVFALENTRQSHKSESNIELKASLSNDFQNITQTSTTLCQLTQQYHESTTDSQNYKEVKANSIESNDSTSLSNSEDNFHSNDNGSRSRSNQSQASNIESESNLTSKNCGSIGHVIQQHNRSSDSDARTNSTELVTETPMKHLPVGSLHPNPCHSRRNIINTPQNKLPTNLNRTHSQTPSTMISHWSQSNMGITPLQTRTVTIKNCFQTPRTVACFTSTEAKDEAPRHFGTEPRRPVRRPLTDAINIKPNDATIYPHDSKSRLFHGSQLPIVEEMRSRSQLELGTNPNKIRDTNTIKRKPETLTKSASPDNLHMELPQNELLKENNQLNTNICEDKEKLIQTKVSEYKQNRNSSQHLESKPSSTELQQQDLTPLSDTISEPPHNYVATKNQSNHQCSKQIESSTANVQFTVPKTNQADKRTIVVKGKEYLILGVLGKGMSGEVLRVQDLSARELCAIKCVNLSRMDKDSAQGCLEEITMLYKLQAPCVVKVFAYEIRYPMLYVVMEMGDTDLSRLLKSLCQEKQISLTMILYYWTEMLTAVKHIHDNGVIHSDLKPANFLLVRGRLKLIDFGIASSMNADMTSVVKNCPIGTLNYISPEALLDIGGNSDSSTHNVVYKITFKSDVWSLGCILYSLVYGHTPFQHIRQSWAKVNAITNPKLKISFPTSITSSDGSQNSSNVPPILIDVMRKCLQHDAKARPTVAELLQIEYIPTSPEQSLSSIPHISPSTLIQAKRTLSENEWQQLMELLEKVRTSPSS